MNCDRCEGFCDLCVLLAILGSGLGLIGLLCGI